MPLVVMARQAQPLEQAEPLTVEMVAEAGRGVIVLIRPADPTALSDRVKARLGISDKPVELRDYGVGAQILLDLGVRDMILLSNTRHVIVALEGYGLKVVEQRPIPASK